MSPFDPELLNHTEAQLDFILEKYATEDPRRGTFTRHGKPKPVPQSRIDAAWSKVLVGKANHAMMAGKLPSDAVLKALREMHAYSKPVFKVGPAASLKPKE